MTYVQRGEHAVGSGTCGLAWDRGGKGVVPSASPHYGHTAGPGPLSLLTLLLLLTLRTLRNLNPLIATVVHHRHILSAQAGVVDGSRVSVKTNVEGATGSWIDENNSSNHKSTSRHGGRLTMTCQNVEQKGGGGVKQGRSCMHAAFRCK